MMPGRVHKASPNSLLGSVYRFATYRPGRRTKKSMVVQSRRNPSVGNNPPGGEDCRNKGRGHVLQRNLQVESIAASRITFSDKGIDGFLKNIPTARSQRDIIRKLVLWRTGVLPGKPQLCQNCEGSTQATRDHIVECSGLKKDLGTFIQPAQEGEHYMLDAALNNGKIWRIPEVWARVKEGLQTVWSRCLGRMWHSNHERSSGAEQKVRS